MVGTIYVILATALLFGAKYSLYYASNPQEG